MKVRPVLRLFVLVCVVSSILHLSTRARAVPGPFKARVVARLPIERNEPVRIRAVKIRGAKVSHRQKFSAADDWLRDLSVTIMNRTNKNIVFAAVDVQFPRPRGLEGPVAVHTLEFGNRELLTRKLQFDQNSPRIVPRQSVDVAFVPHDVERIASLLKDTGYQSGSPEKLHLSVGHVIFEDDSMWYAGSPFSRDPNISGRWVNLEESAKSESNGRGPVRSAKSDGLAKAGFADRWNFSSSFDQSARMRSLFLPASYTTRPPMECNAALETSYPGCGTSGWCGAECRYFQDSVTTTAGNYFLGAASALCTRAACINESGEPSCNTYRSTYVKNVCYGGAGGGGGQEGGGSCYDDWDCDFGYYCDEFGQCQEDLDD